LYFFFFSRFKVRTDQLRKQIFDHLNTLSFSKGPIGYVSIPSLSAYEKRTHYYTAMNTNGDLIMNKNDSNYMTPKQIFLDQIYHLEMDVQKDSNELGAT
jgi:hypothetical protein